MPKTVEEIILEIERKISVYKGTCLPINPMQLQMAIELLNQLLNWIKSNDEKGRSSESP